MRSGKKNIPSERKAPSESCRSLAQTPITHQAKQQTETQRYNLRPQEKRRGRIASQSGYRQLLLEFTRVHLV